MTKETLPTIEEILNNNVSFKQTIEHGSYSCIGIPFADALKAIKEALELHCKRQAEVIAEKAELANRGDKDFDYDYVTISKSSILNAGEEYMSLIK